MEKKIKKIALKVPDVGDAEKIELVVWNVYAGDVVFENQELCELVTEKAAFPLESPGEGILLEILVVAGSVVKVGETLAYLEMAEENEAKDS